MQTTPAIMGINVYDVQYQNPAAVSVDVLPIQYLWYYFPGTQPTDQNYYQKGIYKGELKFYKEFRDIIPGLVMYNRWESFKQVSSFYIR